MKFRSLIALVLCLIMVLGCLAGCGSEKAETSEVEESSSDTLQKKDDATIAPVSIVTNESAETPAEAAKPELEEIAEVEPVSKFAEALELMQYMKAFTAEDAAKWNEPATAELASRAIAAFGGSYTGSGDTVTGESFLAAVQAMLGYDTTDVASAEKLFLTRGFFTFDGAAALNVDALANILMSALEAKTADGVLFGDNFSLIHWVNTDYAEPCNRPGSSWYAIVDGVSEPATAEYTAIPKVVLGTTSSWCDLLEALGYEKDDPKNDEHIPKYFRLSCDGGVLTEQFWKHHCGTEEDPQHGECANDFTGEQDSMNEIYELAENEYVNVYLHNFLGVSDENGLTMYGFEHAEYGPYTDASRPAPGVYITHNYWNGYGMGNGYEVVEPATVIEGTLTTGNVQTTTIDGVEYQNGQTYSFGKKLTTAPINIGKTLYFFLDSNGFVLGCSETPIGE